MKISINLAGIAALVLALSFSGVTYSAGADAEPEIAWWEANQSNDAILLQKDIVVLAEEANRSKPASGPEALRKLNVFLRAGMWAEANQAIDQLHAVCPETREHVIASIYYAACDEVEAWEVAQHVVETFAANISALGLEDRLLKHFTSIGWSVDAIDQWLAARPAGKQGYWRRERLLFHIRHGRGDEFYDEFIAELRSDPQNITAAFDFLELLQNSGAHGKRRWNLFWMSDVFQPKRASEAQRLGDQLKHMREWAPAAAFYRTALATPLTPEECVSVGVFSGVEPTKETIAAMLLAHSKESLATCLLELGNKEEAEQLMREVATIRQEPNIRRFLYLENRDRPPMGVVSKAAAMGVFSKAAQEEETSADDPSADDPLYWLERASRYSRRNKAAESEAAYRKALALTSPQSKSDKTDKGLNELRSYVVWEFAEFLKQQQRDDEAAALLVKELQEFPADSASATRAATMIAYQYPAQIEPFFNWLNSRTTWGLIERQVLWNLLSRFEPSQREVHLKRAETLAAGAHPSRNKTVGWLLNRWNLPARSIPLLEDAIARLTEQDPSDTAELTLCESYLALNDWTNADKALLSGRRYLTTRVTLESRAKIAVAAARDGAKADALRIWKSAANMYLCFTQGLDELAAANLGADLREYYVELGKQLPTSVAPARALKIINAHEAR